jgi:hypothetical protein
MMTWPFEGDTSAMPEDSRSVLLGTNYQEALGDIKAGEAIRLSLGHFLRHWRSSLSECRFLW